MAKCDLFSFQEVTSKPNEVTEDLPTEIIYCGASDPANYEMCSKAGFKIGCQLPNKNVHNICETEIIYCAEHRKQLNPIADSAGFLAGCRLPDKRAHEMFGGVNKKYKLHFADQNWKKPDRKAYMADVAALRPMCATVLDLEDMTQYDEVIDWAEEITQYVDTVIIIPKVLEALKELPTEINGKHVRIGYSIPTSFGGTKIPLCYFQGFPLHLLGGSPEKQMKIAMSYNVESVDSNMILKYGNMCQVWVPDNIFRCKAHLEPLESILGFKYGRGAYRKAFELSCCNVMQAWKKFFAQGKKDQRQDSLDRWF